MVGIVGVIAACGTVIKPPDPDRRLDVRTSGTVFDSDRGYRFVVLPEPSSSLMRLDVRYPVGSVDDPAGKEGLAHLVEHLLTEVEITRDGTKVSIDGETGRLALSSNAFTGKDNTTYVALASPNVLDEMMALEADRLSIGCAGISRELFARERDVVLNELRERQGASGGELARQIYEALYPKGHAYRAVATTETVAKLTYEDVCGFVVGPYRRGIATVVVSGAVDAPAVQRAVGHHFARVPKRTPVTQVAPPVVAPDPGTVRIRGDVDQPTLLVTWPLPPMASREYRLLELAWPHIAGRLEQFAFTFHWGHSAQTSVLGGAFAPVLAISITLDAASKLDDAKSFAGKSADWARTMVSRPGDDRETANWVRHWESSVEDLLSTWESLSGRNQLYADFMQFEPTGSIAGRIKELHDATPTETRALVAEWLAPARMRFLLIEPSGTSRVGAAGSYQGGAEHHGARVDPTLADRPLPLPARTPPLVVERYTQGNGLSVVLWSAGTTPLVHARLVVASGTAHDPVGKEGASSTVGATYVFPDALVFNNRNLAIRIDEMIRSIASELRVPGYDLSDEDKQYLQARLKDPRAKERSDYEHELLVALYGAQHPYARPGMTPSSVSQLSQDVVMHWARTQIVPKNATLVIAGRFDPKLIKRHIAYNTDHIAGGSHAKPPGATPITKRSWIVGTTAKPSPSLEIDLHFVSQAGMDRSHAYRLVLEAVLDSKLTDLRQRGITYGFSAGYASRSAGGLWTISGEVDATKAAEAATTIESILADMRRDPESYRSAFVLARNKVLESLLVNSNNSAAITERLVTLARFGLRDDFFDELARTVAQMTLKDFHPFVGRELAINQEVFGAFGNSDATSAAVSASKAVTESR